MNEHTAEQKEAINKVIDDAQARLRHDMEAAKAMEGIPNPSDFVRAARELFVSASKARNSLLDGIVVMEQIRKGQTVVLTDRPGNITDEAESNEKQLEMALAAFRAAGGGE